MPSKKRPGRPPAAAAAVAATATPATPASSPTKKKAAVASVASVASVEVKETNGDSAVAQNGKAEQNVPDLCLGMQERDENEFEPWHLVEKHEPWRCRPSQRVDAFV